METYLENLNATNELDTMEVNQLSSSRSTLITMCQTLLSSEADTQKSVAQGI
ncbi:MAG TPA: hypothetical protein VJL89_03215 [Thermodesulfovibrionia bacterium]|nr:hypothetical protein [Thermodesulfovibrionia bacterium]